jgi:hypothetical protein
MILKYRRSFALMMAAGLATAIGGAPVANAAVDGFITLVNAKTEQQCIFDYEDQVQAFLAAIPHPEDWQRLGGPAPEPIEPPATEPPATEPPATEPGTALEPPSPAPSPEPAPQGVIVNLDLDQVRAGVEPADAITVTATEPAAPIASSDTTTADTPAAQ